MGMLDRIKRRQFDGLKEFVQNLELTSSEAKIPIITVGVLEDPIFMSWVMKNMKTFDDFMKLPSDDIQKVLDSQDQMPKLFAKIISEWPKERLDALALEMPKSWGKLKDELAYLSEVAPREREGAKNQMVKVARKLAIEEKIYGFGWHLPDPEVFYPKNYRNGSVQLFYENGKLAAEGRYEENRRSGKWVHYYESGKLLAQGTYIEGMKTGEWEFYYMNGKLRSTGTYKADERNGIWKEFDRNEQLTETEFLDGIKVEEPKK